MKIEEQQIMAICFTDTRFFRLFEDKYLVECVDCKEDFNRIKDTVIEKQLSAVSNSLLKELKVSNRDIEVAYIMSINDFNRYEANELNREFAMLLSSLNHSRQTRFIKARISEAYNLCKDGRYTEAIDLVSGLSITPIKPLENSISDMKSAIRSIPALKTGINFIDKVGGWRQGNIVQLTGDNGSMKTSISIWMAIQTLMHNPEATCLYFEKEMPKADVAVKLISRLLQVPIETIQTSTQIESKLDELLSRDTPLGNAIKRFTIVENNTFDSAKDMATTIERYKPTLWVLDYMTMLFDDSGSKDMYGFVKDQMDVLKSVTSSTNSVGMILSQVKQNALSNRNMKIPDKSDSEWSSKINQASAYIYTTFYPSLYLTLDRTWFYVVSLKNRFGSREHGNILCYPELSNYYEAKDDNAKKMREWLNGYYSRGK